jgi:hypothetical protein
MIFDQKTAVIWWKIDRELSFGFSEGLTTFVVGVKRSAVVTYNNKTLVLCMLQNYASFPKSSVHSAHKMQGKAI